MFRRSTRFFNADGAAAAAAAGTTAADTAAAAAAASTDTAAAAAAAATGTDTAAADAAAAAAAATAAAAAAAGDDKGKLAGDTPKAPDKYELTLPEGGFVDEADLTAIAGLAKSKGWSNDEAQAALTEHAGALKAQSDRFLTDLQAHNEIGGDKLAAAQLRANTVLDRFLPADSPEGKTLRVALTKSGYGNYAPLVVLLSRIGKQMTEDKGLSGDAAQRAPGAKRDAATVLYGGS